jgi:hypothetical protein
VLAQHGPQINIRRLWLDPPGLVRRPEAARAGKVKLHRGSSTPETGVAGP